MEYHSYPERSFTVPGSVVTTRVEVSQQSLRKLVDLPSEFDLEGKGMVVWGFAAVGEAGLGAGGGKSV